MRVQNEEKGLRSTCMWTCRCAWRLREDGGGCVRKENEDEREDEGEEEGVETCVFVCKHVCRDRSGEWTCRSVLCAGGCDAGGEDIFSGTETVTGTVRTKLTGSHSYSHRRCHTYHHSHLHDRVWVIVIE